MTSPTSGAQRVLFDQRVPMRDGITLSADVFLPDASAGDIDRWPVILVRTPYVKASATVQANAHYFADHGYAFVLMDVRGRGDSDGDFTPYRFEGPDGYDAIEWCAAQPWSDGGVGTLGGSYPGCIQWLAALEQPPHLKTMIVLVSPSDPFVETPTGLPSPIHLCWRHLVSGRVNQPMDTVNWARVYEHLPLVTMDEAAGRLSSGWREDVAHAQLDEYWDPLCYQHKFDRVSVPVLHISGWYDDEQVGTPLNFIGMTTHGATVEARANQRLLMGPWGHAINAASMLGEVDFGSQAIIDLRGDQARWFDRWLKPAVAQEPGEKQPDMPVRIFVMGSNVWRDEQSWPLPATRWTSYYLASGGRANSRFGDGSLSLQAPEPDAPSDTYTYDPRRPTPFVTEPTSSQIGGPDDYAAIQRRDDVLVYTTGPLARDTEVTGPIRVELYSSSSARDTDFTAMLLDVWPTGFAQRLCDGMVRARFREGMDRPSLIEPGKVYRYVIDCWNTSHVFKAGHSITIQIASAAFPKYDRNPNTGDPLGQTVETIPAQQRVYHDEAHPSAVVLPIIPHEDRQA